MDNLLDAKVNLELSDNTPLEPAKTTLVLVKLSSCSCKAPCPRGPARWPCQSNPSSSPLPAAASSARGRCPTEPEGRHRTSHGTGSRVAPWSR